MNPKGKFLVILNPAARGERARQLCDQIQLLSPRAEIRLTTSPGDACKIAGEAATQGWDAIVAAGGDGTVNEVVNGMAGSNTPMGILPVGTMNVFASELGIPQNNLPAAWTVIEDGLIREVDIPTANGSFFVQLAGAGLDAEVVRQTPADAKKSLGPVSYVLTLAQVAAAPPPRITVHPAGSPPREGNFVLVGNGRLYGGPFVLFKDALLDDGLLDVLIFKNQTHWDIVRYLHAIVFGAHPELHDVEYFQAPSLTLHGPDGTPVELDGELHGTLPCTFSFSPNRLRVFAAAGCHSA
ncbi:MAG: diacylglycerol kinase family lipid kinase [Terrimicrobiaceae bacterium]